MVLANPLPHAIQVRLPALCPTAPASPRAAASVIPAADAAVDEASTYGWDTAFAIRLDDVNAAIRRYAVSPPGFAYEPQDRSCSMNADFGPWRVQRGGDGAILHLAIPLTDGALQWAGTSYPMRGAVAAVEVKLHYLPHDPGGDVSSGDPHKLVLRTAATGADPVAAVTDLAFPDAGPGFVAEALMAGGLQEWLNANLGVFTHIFSVVDVNRIVDQQQFAWLAPTSVSYAYIDGADERSSYLGVLCMTGNRDPSGLAEQVSPNAIPPGSRSGFLISRDRLLQQMILPAIPRVFPGSGPGDFGLSPDGTAVVNRNPLKTGSVQYAGSTYQPWVQSLRITIEGTEVVIDTLTTVAIGLGATAFVKNTAYQRLKLVTTPDHRAQTLSWEDARPPVTDHWTKMDEGTTIALEVLAAVVMAILTIVTDGAALVIALIIVALVVGLMEATPKLIADVVGRKVSDASPSFTLLALNATDPTRWSGAQSFALDWAGLNGALQMGGDPKFAF